MNGKLTHRRVKVFMPYRDVSILHRGLRSILEQAEGIELICLDLSCEDTLECLRSQEAEVVMLVSESDLCHYQPSLAEVFALAPKAKVILVGSFDNKIRVYSAREIVVKGTEDLLESLHSLVEAEDLHGASRGARHRRPDRALAYEAARGGV